MCIQKINLIIYKFKEGIEHRSAAEFLRRVNEGRPYTAKERAAAAELVGKLKHSLASKALKSERTFVNPLEKFFFNRAREVFGWKLFERSEYYLGLAAEAARAAAAGEETQDHNKHSDHSDKLFHNQFSFNINR